jgi:hypothetical protein
VAGAEQAGLGSAQSPAHALAQQGFLCLPDIVAADECTAIAAALGTSALPRAGSRGLLAAEWCRALAVRLKRHPAMIPLLPQNPLAVQCTLFDKSGGRNWLVAPHQDLSIPVRHRIEAAGCSGWCTKEGITFVQPPAVFLAQCLALRLHLDDCGAGNGPLRVVPGSHRYGRLSAGAAADCLRQHGELACLLPRGGVLMMRPLLLHASSKATSSAPRRVLHFLFGPPVPPLGLRWHHYA